MDPYQSATFVLQSAVALSVEESSALIGLPVLQLGMPERRSLRDFKTLVGWFIQFDYSRVRTVDMCVHYYPEIRDQPG